MEIVGMDRVVSAETIEDLIETYEREKIEMERNLFRIQGAIAILRELIGEHIIEVNQDMEVK